MRFILGKLITFFSLLFMHHAMEYILLFRSRYSLFVCHLFFSWLVFPEIICFVVLFKNPSFCFFDPLFSCLFFFQKISNCLCQFVFVIYLQLWPYMFCLCMETRIPVRKLTLECIDWVLVVEEQARSCWSEGKWV